jgi:hypothetical protein
MNMSLRFRGISGSGFEPIQATGGTITEIEIDGTLYRVHTFLNSAENFVITKSSNEENIVDYLVVAGGGGGGGGDNETRPGGGGGGAGGLRTGSLTLSEIPRSYTVSVGIAGSGSIARGGKGGNSAFHNILTEGGGGGGSSGDTSGQSGGNGGSGGGGGRQGPGTGIPGQGHNGSGPTGQGFAWGGSGGGAGGPAPGTGGVVGPGRSLSFASPSPFVYAIGGQGGLTNVNGVTASGFGNGGGGRRSQNPGFFTAGFNGTNGIVIVRYVIDTL